MYDICDDSTFPSAPTLSTASENYYVGQGDLVVAVSWAKDDVSESSGIACGGYTINAVVDTTSTLEVPINNALTYDTQDGERLTFFSNQPSLGGSSIIYNVYISSTEFPAVSLPSTLRVNVWACT